MNTHETVHVIVPATTANLGPGFDSLALALGLYNDIEVMATGGTDVMVRISGEGEGELPADVSNTLAAAIARVYDAVGAARTGLHITCRNSIPVSSGLGSSAAAIVAGLAAGNALLGDVLSEDDLLRMAAEAEGHADNASACLLGGLTIASGGECGLLVRQAPFVPLRVVVVLPEVHMSTHEQRAALPTSIPLADAAANIGRAALVVQALRTADYALLSEALCDRLHVPHRQGAIPGYQAVVEAGLAAGAAAITISGAGPSLVAFAASEHDAIAAAMVEAFRTAGDVSARRWVLPAVSQGVQVTMGPADSPLVP
jgi:homoserine kinase